MLTSLLFPRLQLTSRTKFTNGKMPKASGFASVVPGHTPTAMGAAFLCGEAGIAESTLENSAAYLKGWLEQLQNDKKLIVQAAAQAQKAADFILGTKREEVPTEQK